MSPTRNRSVSPKYRTSSYPQQRGRLQELLCWLKVLMPFMVPNQQHSLTEGNALTHSICIAKAALHVLCYNALILLVGRQEEQPVCKNWVMWCWCGYLSGVRCRLFAYGPTDASAIPKPHHLLPHINPYLFYVSGTGLPRLSWKRPLNWCSSNSCCCSSWGFRLLCAIQIFLLTFLLYGWAWWSKCPSNC